MLITCAILIKMYGSINWAYCDSCQDVHKFDNKLVRRLHVSDDMSCPVLGICKRSRGPRRPLLVPPLVLELVMFPNLIRLWSAARKLIHEDDLILAIGFSFADADSYVTKMVSRSIAEHSQQMVVVEQNPELAYLLRKKFGAHILDSPGSRVLNAPGNCVGVLPTVLQA